jgi:anti-sigma B factor antagonist
MEGIQVSIEKSGPQGDISIIRVGGYIDTTTSSELERVLDSLLKSGVFRIIIDLGNVDYISSAGWGIFISEIKGIRERGGDLKLVNMISDVYEVFELLEFHYILKAYETIDSAINDFYKEGGETSFVVEEERGNDYGGVIEKARQSMLEEESDKPPEGVEEKIKQIVTEHSDWGPSQIAKELKTEKYGFTRVGKITVWKILRNLKLNQ